MKSIITLDAITIVATAALVGCNQNAPTGSTDAPATNSNTSGSITNLPETNSPPNLHTNIASANQ